MVLTPRLFWMIVACFELHWERWQQKIVSVCDKKWKIRSTHLIFVPKRNPLPLPFNEIEGNARPRSAGSKMARCSSRSVEIRRFLHWAKVGENGLFFFVKQSFLAIGWFGHLALVVPRDGKLPELKKPRWLQRYFELDGFIIAMSDFERFFVWCNSKFTITSIWKMHDRGMQRHVPCLPACRCILRIHRGLNTVKIFGKQVGIFAQNLSDVIGTVTKKISEIWHDVCPGPGFSLFILTLFLRETARPFLLLYI